MGRMNVSMTVLSVGVFVHVFKNSRILIGMSGFEHLI